MLMRLIEPYFLSMPMRHNEPYFLSMPMRLIKPYFLSMPMRLSAPYPLINPLPHKTEFWWPELRHLLKTLWEISIFSLSHNVFCPSKKNIKFSSHIYFVVGNFNFCKPEMLLSGSELYIVYNHRLLTYPPPPEKRGISITNEDLYCLQQGEFLNDVIIDFYLK